ncbi:hypothetical protein F5B17DRAFT_437787 [Nemania serpens]|nr:hypothetical protein F5B17DRAFT_437787 [Nemania serpens]
MHRAFTKRVLGQTLCLSCRKTAADKFVGFVVRPIRRPREVPFPYSQRWCAYHAPAQVLSTSGSHHDTIYALSSANGKAGIAVIRVSGPACKQIYSGLCPHKEAPIPRYATLRTLFAPDTQGSEVLDFAAIVIYFPGPKTVTGEDVLELHVHGAIPKCTSDGRIRYAEPGEFTRRAFMHDRLDLAQVEALSEMLAAETEQQRRAAVRGSSGSLGRTYEDWRRDLLEARAELEALIDFQEDQHFDESPASLIGGVTQKVRDILRNIGIHEMASQRSELLRNGIQIALLGPPNVGKSSFMNQIVGREASIVSGESGTTRDVIEASLDIRGYLCTFADTAGFRTATASGNNNNNNATHSQPIIGAVEEEGIRRARARATQSDVIIVLVSVEERIAGGHEIRYDMETLKLAAASQRRLVLVNKIDAVPEADLRLLVRNFQDEVLRKIPGLEKVTPTLISCKEARNQGSDQQDPGGIRLVADQLVLAFQDMTSLPTSLHGVTERQRQLLVQCRNSLEDYVEVTENVDEGDREGDHDLDLTMAAEHLRYAASCLGRITGRGEAGDVEEILGVIFEK